MFGLVIKVEAVCGLVIEAEARIEVEAVFGLVTEVKAAIEVEAVSLIW